MRLCVIIQHKYFLLNDKFSQWMLLKLHTFQPLSCTKIWPHYRGRQLGFHSSVKWEIELIDLKRAQFRYCGVTTVTEIWAGRSTVLIPAGEIRFFLSPHWVFGQPSTLVHGYCRLFPMGYSSLGATDHWPSFPAFMECIGINLPLHFLQCSMDMQNLSISTKWMFWNKYIVYCWYF
jgi:hypothetical protein